MFFSIKSIAENYAFVSLFAETCERHGEFFIGNTSIDGLPNTISGRFILKHDIITGMSDISQSAEIPFGLFGFDIDKTLILQTIFEYF